MTAPSVFHFPNRVYVSEAGDLHLFGGKLFDVNEVDQSAALQGIPAMYAAGALATAAPLVAGKKIVYGLFTSLSASDTLVTGLSVVEMAMAVMQDAPVVGCESASASIGDQVATPVAGSILLQSWKTLGGTPVAASTFSLKIAWLAIGH